MEQYTWIVAGLNWAVHMFLLLAVCKWEGIPFAALRMGLASLLGAGYACVCLQPDFAFMAGGIWRVVCLALVSLVGFGLRYSTLRRGCGFSVLWLAMHGLAAGFQQRDIWTGILWAALLLLLYQVGMEREKGTNLIPVRIRYGGKTVEITALRDTGNLLSDPVTGKSVLVAGPQVAWDLLGLTAEQLRDPVRTLECGRIGGLRLVPYRSVGQGAGLLLAMHFADVMVGDQHGGQVVAFCPDALGNGFEALAGGVL